MATETRADHIEWCKQRALAYVDVGDLPQAYTSMVGDLRKHPETANHSGIDLGMMMLMGGHLGSVAEMRKFINGFR